VGQRASHLRLVKSEDDQHAEPACRASYEDGRREVAERIFELLRQSPLDEITYRDPQTTVDHYLCGRRDAFVDLLDDLSREAIEPAPTSTW
jgi:hypothetical protein